MYPGGATEGSVTGVPREVGKVGVGSNPLFASPSE